jgi:small-conductance mechanosensitive channel
MFSSPPTVKLLLTASILATSGVVLGLVARKVISWILTRKTDLEPGQGRAIISDALKGLALAWFSSAGVYAALLTLPLRVSTQRTLTKPLVAFVILAGAFAGARIAGGLVGLFAARHDTGSRSIFANLTRAGVLVIGILIVLQTFGISIAPVLTALGVGGLAVALALQDTLSNLFAGLHVLTSRKVVPGDVIKLNSGEQGRVIDINWRNTSLHDQEDNVILVPNAKLAEAILTNYHRPASTMQLLVQVRVGYESDLADVERVTLEVARQVMAEVEGGVPDFQPSIRFHTFDEFSIGFEVELQITEHPSQFLVKHEFFRRLHQAYQREGIEMSLPIRALGSSSQFAPSTEGNGAGLDGEQEQDKKKEKGGKFRIFG